MAAGGGEADVARRRVIYRGKAVGGGEIKAFCGFEGVDCSYDEKITLGKKELFLRQEGEGVVGSWVLDLGNTGSTELGGLT